MRLLATTAAALLLATSVSAMDLGMGLSLNTEVTAEYKVDAENMTLTSTPELAYTNFGFDFAASTELALYNDEFVIEDTFSTLPTIDFTVERVVMEGMTAYVETSYDLDAGERGEITLGTTFAF